MTELTARRPLQGEAQLSVAGKLPRIDDRHVMQLAAAIISAKTRGRAVTGLVAAEAGDGTSTVVVNVAQVLERMLASRVVIVDLNLHNPVLHLHYGLSRNPGLLDLMRGKATVREVVHVAEPGLLGVLPIGTAESDDTNLLLRPNGLGNILDVLRHQGFDTILLDCPPVLAASESAVLAAQAENSYLVMRAGRTQWSTAERAMKRLSAAGAVVRGVVLNQVASPIPAFLSRHLTN
jgi:Mrp family chromosome partitioning ATPase